MTKKKNLPEKEISINDYSEEEIRKLKRLIAQKERSLEENLGSQQIKALAKDPIVDDLVQSILDLRTLEYKTEVPITYSFDVLELILSNDLPKNSKDVLYFFQSYGVESLESKHAENLLKTISNTFETLIIQHRNICKKYNKAHIFDINKLIRGKLNKLKKEAKP